MPIKILLADDSLTIQKVVELTFSDAETRLMAVGSGDRAVQALDDFQPDIVLADVVMPGLTGYDVCDAVKQRPGGVFIPVVLLTGTFEPFDRARAERVGSDAIVTKPFDSHALQGLVRDLVARARAVREEAAAAAAAAALAPPAPLAAPVPPPAPEPPPTMILSEEDLEAEVPTQGTYAEDTGATQAMPALVLPESFPLPAEAEEPFQKVEESDFRTMAMRIPTAEELAAAAPKEIVEPAPAFEPPPPPPPPPSVFYEPEAVSLVPPPPSPFYRPEAALAVPPPPPAFYEPEVAAILPPPSPFDMSPAIEVEPPAPAGFEPEFVPPVPPPPPAFYEPEPAFVPPPPPPPPAFHEAEPALFVPPIPPLPPAFDAPQETSFAETAAPFEPESEQAPEPFLVEMGSPALATPEGVPLAPFETVPEPGAASGQEEIEVALYDLAEESSPAESNETPVAEEPAFDLLVGEPVPPAAEAILVPEAEVVEDGSVEPFPEMDEPVPGVDAEAAPWDEGPAVEIPPPPPELSGGPDDSEGTEPITRDIEADLEAFEASGRVTRRPEIWERHAALIGEEAPADIDRHGSLPEELQEPAMEDPSSSELEAMAAAARIEDLSALIPSSSAPAVMAAAVPPPLPSEETPEAAVTTAPLGIAAATALSDADVDRIARRVVQLLSDKAVRDIAWEVVPEYAERLVRERIAEVERAG
jgi:CheY-like chemotaxis protein